MPLWSWIQFSKNTDEYKNIFNQWWQLWKQTVLKNTQYYSSFNCTAQWNSCLIFICEPRGRCHLQGGLPESGQRLSPDRMVKSAPRSIKFPLRSCSLNVGIELRGWGAPEWWLHGGVRLAKTVFVCLWKEVYVVSCLRQLKSTPTGGGVCVRVCVRTWGCLWRFCLTDTNLSSEFSAAIDPRTTTLDSIPFFHTVQMCFPIWQYYCRLDVYPVFSQG